MSKSYKKSPIVKAKSRKDQSLSNRKVRRMNKVLPCYYEHHDTDLGTHEHIANGRQHRKVYAQYDVIEYTIYYSKEMWRVETEGEQKGLVSGNNHRNYCLTEQDWLNRFRRK